MRLDHTYQQALSLLAALGRMVLASLFIWSGIAKLLAPSAIATYMASGGLPASESLAMAVGSFEFLAGLCLGVGFRTRPIAFALAAFTLIASLLFHNYWAMAPEQQVVQQLLFSKNLALVGALLFIAALGAGYWGLDTYAGNTLAKARHAVRPEREGTVS
jgi:putative oxidoreductase